MSHHMQFSESKSRKGTMENTQNVPVSEQDYITLQDSHEFVLQQTSDRNLQNFDQTMFNQALASGGTLKSGAQFNVDTEGNRSPKILLKGSMTLPWDESCNMIKVSTLD